MFSIPIISCLILLPIISIFIILTIRGDDETLYKNVKYISILTSIIHMVATTYVWLNFSKVEYTYQFIEKVAIIPNIDFNYYMGIDGISLLMISLSSILILFIFLFIDLPKENTKVYAISFLFLLSTSVGTFSALDLVMFYVFYEMSVIPVFFLIGVLGEGDKIYASFKFLLYTMFGSILMLVAIIVMLFIAKTSSIADLDTFAFSYNYQIYLFIALFIAFAIKSAVFPFHTWITDTYESSPLALNIGLSGILMKFGVYGILRFILPIAPLAILEYGTIVNILLLITLIYAGLIAFQETNFKRLLAYFSMSHVALIIAGIFSTDIKGIEGALFQAMSHSIYNLGFFLALVFLQRRYYSNQIADFKGIAKVMPVFSVLLFILGLAAIGLPLTSSFIGELLSLFGIFQTSRVFAFLFTFSILISAIVIIRLNREVLFGGVNQYTKSFKDLHTYEFLSLAIIVGFILFTGIYPHVILDIIHTAVANIIEQFKNGINITDI